MITHVSRGLLAALVGTIGLIAPALAAQRTDTLTIEGSVWNGTAGGAVPVGQVVRVIALVGDRVEGSWEATVQADGSYALVAVPLIDGATYAVGLEYGSVAYVDRVEVPPDGGIVRADLTVYESVAVDPGIRFEQSAVVLALVSADRAMVEVTEVHSIVNPTDVTFRPSAEGPGGPSGLLVFGLPPGASGLTPLMGIDPGQIVQIDRGFAALIPISPGRTDLSFRYRLPSEASTLRLERTLRYPVEAFRVLTGETALTMMSPELPEATRADIGGRAFQAIAGGPFERGQALTVVVSGLPVRAAPLESVPLWWIAAIGAAIGIGLVGFAWGRTSGGAPAPVIADEEQLVDRLLEIERERAAGRLDEDAYEAERRATIARALAAVPRLAQRADGENR